MLDGIDDIEWSRLGHAYGGAADVPGQIKALLSPDTQTRGKALDDLYGNIYHQGTRYEATAYAVPFLLELLADSDTPGRADIAGLLSAIAIGYDSWCLPDGIQIAELRATAEGGQSLLESVPTPRNDDLDDDDDDDFDEEGEEEEDEYSFAHLSEEEEGKLYAYLAVRAYDAVGAGIPVFLDLLGDPDPALQTMAAYALAWFPEQAATILPRLTSSTFDSAAVSATASVSIGLLGGRPDRALLQDPQPIVRWGAAVALGETEELVRWVTGEATAEAEIPFLDGDLGGLASLVLGRLDTDAAFDALLARIPSVTGVAALPPVSVALRLAFPSTGAPDAPSLTPRQRRLAQALADSPETWLHDGMNFGNFSQLVGAHGLPRSSEAMSEFLRTKDAS